MILVELVRISRKWRTFNWFGSLSHSTFLEDQTAWAMSCSYNKCLGQYSSKWPLTKKKKSTGKKITSSSIGSDLKLSLAWWIVHLHSPCKRTTPGFTSKWPETPCILVDQVLLVWSTLECAEHSHHSKPTVQSVEVNQIVPMWKHPKCWHSVVVALLTWRFCDYDDPGWKPSILQITCQHKGVLSEMLWYRFLTSVVAGSLSGISCDSLEKSIQIDKKCHTNVSFSVMLLTAFYRESLDFTFSVSLPLCPSSRPDLNNLWHLNWCE